MPRRRTHTTSPNLLFLLLIPLSVPLFFACKKKTAPPDESDTCVAEKKAVTECRGQLEGVRASLDTCVQHAKASPVPAETPPGDPPMKIVAGKIYVLLQGAEIVVMNERPVGDPEWIYPYGSTCRVDPEAKVKVVGPHVDADGGPTYLVRYSRDPAPYPQKQRPPDEDPVPRECPDYTLFFIDDPTVLFEDTPDGRIDVVRRLLNSEKH